MIPQIPYAAVGIGVAVLFGVWAFIVADTVRARAVIAGAALLVFLSGAVLRSQAGQIVSLAGWVVFGIGCIIYLRLNGLGVR